MALSYSKQFFSSYANHRWEIEKKEEIRDKRELRHLSLSHIRSLQQYIWQPICYQEVWNHDVDGWTRTDRIGSRFGGRRAFNVFWRRRYLARATIVGTTPCCFLLSDHGLGHSNNGYIQTEGTEHLVDIISFVYCLIVASSFSILFLILSCFLITRLCNVHSWSIRTSIAYVLHDSAKEASRRTSNASS